MGRRSLALAVALVLIVLGSIAVAQYSVSRFYYLALDYYEVKASNTAYGAFVGYGALGYTDLIAFRLDNTYYLVNTTANTYYNRIIEFEGGGYRDTGVWYCGSMWGLWAIGNNIYWERIIRFYDSTLTNMLYEGYATYAGAFYGLGVDYLVLGSASFGASVFDMEVYSLSCAGGSLSVSRGNPVAVPPSGYYTGGRPVVVGSFKDYVLMVAPVQSDTRRAVAYGVGALPSAEYFYLGNVVLEFDLNTYFKILIGYETSTTFEFAVVTSDIVYWVTVYKDTKTFTYTAYPGSYGTFTDSDLVNPGTLVPDSLGNPMYALYGNPLRIYHFGTGYFMTVGFNTPGSVIASYKRDMVLPVSGIMRSLYSYGYLKLKVAELTTTVVSPITVYDTVTTTATQTVAQTTTQTVTNTVTETTTQTVTQTTTQTVTVAGTTTTVYDTVTTTTTVTEVLVVPQVRTVTVTTTTTKTAIGVVGLEPVTLALLALAVLFVVLLALLVKKR